MPERAGSPLATARYALLAHPVGHSVSPAMQMAAFGALGLAASYEAMDVRPDDLPAAVTALRQAPWAGANLSVPHKSAVLPLLDELSPSAERLGAVNTIVRRGDRLWGHNTDLPGFRTALLANGRRDWSGARAVVLGAGGAARAVVAALVEEGAKVALRNRDGGRAERLAADLGGGRTEVLEERDLEAAVRGCELLVQTTTVGMQGGPPGSPLPAGLLPERGLVVDLIYRPALTPLLAAAMAAGLRVQNGLPMLVHQGAEAFEAWTGRPAPVAVMGSAAEEALGGPGRGWTGLAAEPSG